MFEIQISDEMEVALDGQARWIVSIVSNFCRKPCNKWVDPEDFFQDFVVFYLRKRHLYDANRAARTRFIMILARSFAHHYVRSKRPPMKNLNAEPARYKIDLDADEHRFVEAASKFHAHGGHTAPARVVSLAKKMGIGRLECQTILDAIQTKVKKNNQKFVLIHN